MTEATRASTGDAVECPRCGYDLGGVVTSWASACPLDGECHECGLALRWGDALRGRLRPPGWSFEHAPRRPARALFRTALMTLRPWRFWRELAMFHRVRPVRAGCFCLMAMLSGWFLGACVLALVALAQWLAWEGYGNPFPSLLMFAAYPFHGLGWWGSQSAVMWQMAAVVVVTLFPLPLGLLRHTMREGQVLPEHIWRVWIYTAAALPAVLWGFAVLRHLLVLFPLRRPPAWHAWLSAPPSVWLIVGGWMTLGMALACRRYLRLPHAWGIAVAAWVICACVSLIVILVGFEKRYLLAW